MSTWGSWLDWLKRSFVNLLVPQQNEYKKPFPVEQPVAVSTRNAPSEAEVIAALAVPSSTPALSELGDDAPPPTDWTFGKDELLPASALLQRWPAVTSRILAVLILKDILDDEHLPAFILDRCLQDPATKDVSCYCRIFGSAAFKEKDALCKDLMRDAGGSKICFVIEDLEYYEQRYPIVFHAPVDRHEIFPPPQQPVAPPAASAGSREDKARIEATREACEYVRKKIDQEKQVFDDDRGNWKPSLLFVIDGNAKTNWSAFRTAVEAKPGSKCHYDTTRDEWGKVPKDLKHAGRVPEQ